MLTITAPSKSVPLQQVKLDDPFWSQYVKLVREVVIPYQYEALHDRIPGVEPSHAIANLRIAAGRAQGNSAGSYSRTAIWPNGWRRPPIPSPYIRMLIWRTRWTKL